MRPVAKVGLVGGGYLGALALAAAVVAVYIALTPGVDRVLYSGMTAFGDSLLFLAVFAVAAIVPTCTALYFLRSYRWFWTLLSVMALVFAATALASFGEFLWASDLGPHAVMGPWSALGSLKILLAPLFALAFFVSAVMAPSRSPRVALLVATAIEAAVFGSYAAILFLRWAR